MQHAAMQHYVGLDVSVKETSVCIIDKAGKVIREVKVATECQALSDRSVDTQLKREQSLWPTAECLLRLAEDPGSARPERHFPSTQLKRE
jgi:hypothetical protein